VTVTPLVPDAPLAPALRDEDSAAPASSFPNEITRAFESTAQALEKAAEAESAFVHGHGGLQEMVLERAQADIALSLAGAVTSRVTQALNTVLGMQL